MYLLIVLLPFLGFIFAGGFGRYLGFRGASFLSIICVSSSAILSCIAFYEVALSGSPCYIKLAPWFYSEMFDASWGFLFDSLTVVMLVVITFVSSLVHLYSISYMAEDPHLPRFMSYLSIFTFFMLMLVTGDNFLQMFFGWEGVGLASYLLINFWFTRLQANKSAIKAMLVNRVGDFGLALGIMGIFSIFKTVDYITVFACANQFASNCGDNYADGRPMVIGGSLVDMLSSSEAVMHVSNLPASSFIFFNTEFNILNTLCLLLFVGAIGKSAQLGLHTWLPDAMEGPTPVSALIHAATMVTAGVFMIARCSPLFEYAPTALTTITFLGAMTSFFAATTGVVQNDLKRVIAYSTCSQLGYMIFACGISNYSVGVFHLMNHAFFKALLFLSAGSVIHALSDEQDMRKMGGIAKILPFTYAMMVIGSLALIGFPFLTGFYSKDVILEVAYAKYTLSGNFAYWLGSLSALFTSYYSFRLLFLTFFGPMPAQLSITRPQVGVQVNNITDVDDDRRSHVSNATRSSLANAHDASIIMGLPLILLAFGSLFVGFLGKDMMIGLGTDFWGNSLFTLPQNSNLLESEYIPQSVKFIPLLFGLLGGFLAYYINISSSGIFYAYFIKTSVLGRSIYTFLNKRWLFDKVYNDLFVKQSLSFGYEFSFKTLDKGIIEILGPYGISQTVQSLSRQISKIQSGFVYHYALSMLIGLTLFIAIIGLWDFLSFWIDSRLFFIQFITFIFYHANIHQNG